MVVLGALVGAESEDHANRRGLEVWVWSSKKRAGWAAGCGRRAAETLLLLLASIQAFFPDSLLCSIGPGAAGILGGLSRASSGAGPGGWRVWS